jgi:hypothetical protein
MGERSYKHCKTLPRNENVCAGPETDVVIFKIFSPKHLAKKWRFNAHTNASFCKNLIITLVFVKNVNIFAENWQKSQKIVIITSTPGLDCQFLLFLKYT